MMMSSIEPQEDGRLAEVHATAVLRLIEESISVLRRTPEWTATPTISLKLPLQPPKDDPNVLLYQRFEAEGLVVRIQQLFATIEAWYKLYENKSTTETDNNSTQIQSDFSLSQPIIIPNEEEANERVNLVRMVMLPLIASLQYCYVVLDALPEQQAARSKMGMTKSRTNSKPTPPKGLLSLQNYTDVACLLEWTVCTSILPNLESNCTKSIQDRIRHSLPKSLRGRLPRSSLLWGEQQMQQQTKEMATISSNSSASLNQSRSRATSQELKLTSHLLASLVLLDRFRPMLLPRHIADIYLAMFQSERLDIRQRERSTKVPIVTNQQTTLFSDSPRFRQMKALLRLKLPITEEADQRHDRILGVVSEQMHPMDTHVAVLAFQSLLFSGGQSKTPAWLRSRVGRLLTFIATVDLSAIVHVFVHAAAFAPSETMSGASLRLAQTLCVPNPTGPDSTDYYAKLCRQLVLNLSTVVDPPSVSSSTTANNNGVDPRIMAGALTVWAVLFLLPIDLIYQHFMPILTQGMISCSTTSNNEPHGSNLELHRSVRRICTLLLALPPITSWSNARKIGQIFLLPLVGPTSMEHGKPVTVMSQLLRIMTTASGTKVTHVSSKQMTMMPTIREDSLWALRMIVHTLISFPSVENNNSSSCGNGTEVAAIALVHAVSINQWDIQGNYYENDTLSRTYDNDDNDSRLSSMSIGQHDEQGSSLLPDGNDHFSRLISNMEDRARAVMSEIISPFGKLSELISKESGIAIKDESTEAILMKKSSLLPSRMFHLLLLIYFSTTSSTCSTARRTQLLPQSFHGNFESIKMTTMMLLPLLCEICSPASLLMGNISEGSRNEEGAGVLVIIKLILDGCVSSTDTTHQSADASHPPRKDNATTAPPSHNDDDHSRFRVYDALIGEAKENQGTKAQATQPNVDDEMPSEAIDDMESLFSISSLVLSLLVAMLELGTQRRSQREEEYLQSMIPILHPLAILEPDMQSNHQSDEHAIASARAEIAEMASHAMALISSRAISSSNEIEPTDTTNKSPRDMMNERIQQAESDLGSNQPPIRARGVVTLRHIARAYIASGGDILSDDPTSSDHEDTVKIFRSKNVAQNRKGPLIVELSPDDKGKDLNTLRDTFRPDMLENLLRISIKSLADSESYVFLAAIQTIVAIGDVCPADVIPKLGHAISIGRITLFRSTTSSQEESSEVINLTSAQRIKLTEALIFTIRRRGPGLYLYVQTLMDCMIYGSRQDGIVLEDEMPHSTADAEKAIQSETHNFFKQGNETHVEDDDDQANRKHQLDELRIRVNTGGPIFENEEDDAVRAACISIVSEVITISEPFSIATYVPNLVQLGVNAVRLESSRPVRRAAALLCRDLYNCALREVENTQEGGNPALSFLVELVSSDELSLQRALQRCISGKDVDQNTSEGTKVAIKNKIRLFDPATVARCQEALDIRETINQSGNLSVAEVLSKTRKKDEQDATSLMIGRLINKVPSGDTNKYKGQQNVVRAMKGLSVDADDLRLQE